MGPLPVDFLQVKLEEVEEGDELEQQLMNLVEDATTTNEQSVTNEDDDNLECGVAFQTLERKEENTELKKLLVEMEVRIERLEKWQVEADLQLKRGSSFSSGCSSSGSSVQDERILHLETCVEDSRDSHSVGEEGSVAKDTKQVAGQGGASCALEETENWQKEVVNDSDPEGPASLGKNRDDSGDNQKNADMPCVAQSSFSETTELSKLDKTEAGRSGTSKTPCHQDIRPITRSKKKAVTVANRSPGSTCKNALTNPLLLPTPKPVEKSATRQAQGQIGIQAPNKSAVAEGPGYISETEVESTSAGRMSMKKPFPCSPRHSWKRGLRRHVVDDVHKWKQPYGCKFCGRAFNRKHILEGHEKSVHKVFRAKNPRDSTCQVCDRVCRDNWAVKVHMRTHTQEKPHSCHLCLKTFAQSSDLKRHVASVHEGKTFNCSDCISTFKSRNGLKGHRRTHTCRWCPKEFKCVSKGKEHMQTCKPKCFKGVTCLFCDKVYRKRWNLEVHMSGHIQEKPYICSVCCREFATNVGLWQHNKRKHKASRENANEGVAISRTIPADGSEHVGEASEAGTGREDTAKNLDETSNSLSEGAYLCGGSGDASLLDQCQLGPVCPCEQVIDEVFSVHHNCEGMEAGQFHQSF